MVLFITLEVILVADFSSGLRIGKTVIVLMRYENLEARHNLSERDRTILLPVLNRGNVVDHNDEVIFFALVMDLGLGCVAAGHFGGVLGRFDWN